MILADTSVWITHLRSGTGGLTLRLEQSEVATHPFIIGELACGNLRHRKQILHLLDKLPSMTIASHAEVLSFIEAAGLAGSGIGYIDAHLLASARLDRIPLWTEDRRLEIVAKQLKIHYDH